MLSNLPDGVSENDPIATWNDKDIEGEIEVSFKIKYSTVISGSADVEESKEEIEKELKEHFNTFVENTYLNTELDIEIERNE